MKTSLREEADRVWILATDVDPSLHAYMSAFDFTATEAGFEKKFAPGSAELRPILIRFQASIESMVRQVAGLDPVPWQEALAGFMRLVGDSVDWWLVGSTALAVRGIDVTPRDIDLVVADTDFRRVTDLLDPYVVEPVCESDTWIARWFCRAFLGARLEWVSGVRDWVDSSAPSDFGPVARSRSEWVTWEGAAIRVPPLDLQLAACKRRDLKDRLRRIEEFLGASA